MSIKNADQKKQQILDHESQLANQLALQVLEKPNARLASFRERLAVALPGVQILEPPCDPLLFNCVAGLAFLTEAPASAWPAPTLLTGSVRDAA